MLPIRVDVEATLPEDLSGGRPSNCTDGRHAFLDDARVFEVQRYSQRENVLLGLVDTTVTEIQPEKICVRRLVQGPIAANGAVVDRALSEQGPRLGEILQVRTVPRGIPVVRAIS
ncbi:MAG: hypothetical protein WD627_00435 [Actinomycetota bacterium]